MFKSFRGGHRDREKQVHMSMSPPNVGFAPMLSKKA
jgi:hypothetical protein